MKQPRTRRAFVQGAALAAAAPFLPGVAPHAEAQQVDPLAAAAARNLTDLVRLRFGRTLTEGQLKDIYQQLGRSLAGAELMKRVPLENGDEPAFVFVPD